MPARLIAEMARMLTLRVVIMSTTAAVTLRAHGRSSPTWPHSHAVRASHSCIRRYYPPAPAALLWHMPQSLRFSPSWWIGEDTRSRVGRLIRSVSTHSPLHAPRCVSHPEAMCSAPCSLARRVAWPRVACRPHMLIAFLPLQCDTDLPAVQAPCALPFLLTTTAPRAT